MYTEMVTAPALTHGDKTYLLDYNDCEHPVALQVGGSDPVELAHSAELAQKWAYDEINLNCGCPSDRVQNGMIGACLMRHPELVATAIKTMKDHCNIEVTVKHRIGVDDMEDYDGLVRFIEPIANVGCNTFIIHARKAWLQGLSPKENRDIPPLNYDLVYQIKREFPELSIIINGGITTLDQCHQHLQIVDGVMIGREAYHNPYLLATVDRDFFDCQKPIKTREQVALEYVDYCQSQLQKGVKLHHLSRHLLGLFQGVKGARQFRRTISENAHKADASITILHEALELIRE